MRALAQVLTAFILINIWLYESWAQVPKTQRTAVFFGNGINTTWKEADDSRKALIDKLSSILSQNEFQSLEFRIAYNPTSGFFLDLLESSIQKLTEETKEPDPYKKFWRLLENLDDPIDAFKQAVLEVTEAAAATFEVNNQTLGDHLIVYKSKIAAGKKVLVVTHSQGNFFANEAYDSLSNTERNNFSIVSVANPAKRVAGYVPDKERYTTLHEDKVIKTVRAASIRLNLPLPLNSNTPNEGVPPCGILSLCHNFIEFYVDGSVSGPRILNHIIDASPKCAHHHQPHS